MSSSGAIILKATVQARSQDPNLLLMGVPAIHIVNAVQEQAQKVVVPTRPITAAMMQVEADRDAKRIPQLLTRAGFLEFRSPHFYKVTKLGVEHARDPVKLWESIVATEFMPNQELLLRAVNKAGVISRVAPPSVTNAAWKDLAAEFEDSQWQNNAYVQSIAQDLDQMGLIKITSATLGGNFSFSPTYQGLVWELRRGLVGTSRWIDELLDVGETTSVEIKRELHLDTHDQKAEFITDLIGLANTQSSGRRLLIVGFKNNTTEYYQPPDPRVKQERIEQLVRMYITPNLGVRYSIEDYRAGPIAIVEVIRERHKLPYKVAKAISGEKRSITERQIFVRHGSLTELPSDRELKEIEEEGERARQRARDAERE